MVMNWKSRKVLPSAISSRKTRVGSGRVLK